MLNTYHFGVVTQFDNIYYVSKNGKDTNFGKNTEESFLTITYALSISTSADLIVILPGIYTENLSISTACNIIGYDNELTEIVGKTTINHSLGIVNIKNIKFSNINDNVIDVQCLSDIAEFHLKDNNISSIWNLGTGQTVNTSKAAVKLSRGIININSGEIRITAQNDDIDEHNTSAFWATGDQKIDFTCFSVSQYIVNSTDDHQNLESIFNNNTNANSSFSFKNGKMVVEGKLAATNYLTVFYNYNTTVIGNMIVEGNVISLKNSSFGYTCFNFNSNNHIIFTNNSIFPTNITNMYMANEYSGTGSIDVKNCYFDMSTIPLVNGDVDYIISLNNGYFLTSDRIGINTTNPAYPLDVNGTTKTVGLIVDGSSELTSVSTGTTDNDKLVTKGYVDDKRICKYAASTALSTTTSTTFQQKLRLTTGTIPAGTYKISWSYQWYYNRDTRNFQAQIQIDDITTIMSHVEEPKDVAVAQRRCSSGFYITTFSSTSYNIDLDYRSSNSADTAGIINAHLIVERID